MTQPFRGTDGLSQEEISKTLDGHLSAADGERGQALAGLLVLNEALAEMNRRELKRLELKYGTESQEVEALKSTSTFHEAFRRDTAYESDLSLAKTPSAEKHGYVLYGVVRDSAGAALPDLTVALYDEASKVLSEFSFGCTDKHGYFSIRYIGTKRKGSKKARIVAPADVQSAVADIKAAHIYVIGPKQVILHVEDEPLHPSIGEVDFRIVVVTSNDTGACTPPPRTLRTARSKGTAQVDSRRTRKDRS
jgi:hypothetical protein